MLEGYSALSYLAAFTGRVKLGTLVTGMIYRYPGLLVKTATTLDVLSGGRAYLGIGAGWNERESRGLGVPFPSTRERFERLEEALEIAHQMWSGELGPCEGEHYQLAEALNSPQALGEPQPPVMIGGMGEKRTLRLVARYSGACNLFIYGGSDVVRHCGALQARRPARSLRGCGKELRGDRTHRPRHRQPRRRRHDGGRRYITLPGDERGRHTTPDGRAPLTCYPAALTRLMLDQGRNS
jgi:alkanesulfonate monooxygenase SsuD/methylene tetrahydromethanopterin reductase-like flavin-dependent oxidoreductase (luciferase family)